MSAFSVYCHVEGPLGPIETFKQCYLGADHLTFEGGRRFQKEYYCKLWRKEKRIVPGLADKKICKDNAEECCSSDWYQQVLFQAGYLC